MLVAGHLMLPLSAPIFHTLSTLFPLCYIGNNSPLSSSVDSETSNLSLIHHTSPLSLLRLVRDESPQPGWVHMSSTLTLRSRFSPAISPLEHIQNKFTPSTSLSLSQHSDRLLLSLFGDVMETKYCTVKLFYSAFSLYTPLLSAPAFKRK